MDNRPKEIHIHYLISTVTNSNLNHIHSTSFITSLKFLRSVLLFTFLGGRVNDRKGTSCHQRVAQPSLPTGKESHAHGVRQQHRDDRFHQTSHGNNQLIKVVHHANVAHGTKKVAQQNGRHVRRQSVGAEIEPTKQARVGIHINSVLLSGSYNVQKGIETVLEHVHEHEQVEIQMWTDGLCKDQVPDATHGGDECQKISPQCQQFGIVIFE